MSQTPIYLLGAGEAHSHEHISAARNLTTSAAKEAGQRAFEMSGLRPTIWILRSFMIVLRQQFWWS